MKASRKELEEQQREHLAQEAKAEKQNKQKERELVLQRIADDRRSVQAKIQWAQITDPPAAQGHRPEGRAQLASDGQCLLMIRLPSGQCLRERFPADCPLQHVTQRLSTLHPDLPPFTLLQGFPKRRFGPAELPCSLQALGLTPSATLCVLATEPLPSGTCALAAPQARDEPLQPPGPQALPMEEHAWGRGEILSLVPEQAMAEGMFPEAEELRLALSSPARRVVPGKPGVHVLWESTSPSHHRWGQGQRLTLENPEQAPTAPTVCSPLAEELSPPAPRKQYCSSLASLTPPLAERLLADMILHRRLRPKTLELFFGCHIQTLVLSCYPYATNELLRQLRAFQSLRHLSLVSCSLLTDQGLSVVRHLQRLQHLNLSACVKLTDACLHFIKGLPHLSHLTLDQTKISDCGMADYLHSAPSALSHLSLNRTAITERTLRLLPQCAPGLVLLGLKQTEISDFSALQQLSHLHTLHLDDTRVSQASLAALASHPALSTLTLSGVQSVDGDRALQLVSGLPLAQLSLPSRHTVTDSGLHFLCRLEGLLELDLTDFTHITDEGLRHLPQLHRLRRLSLCNTPVTDSGLQHLQGLQHLEELCLDRTAVSSAGVARCITQLPLLQVLGLASTPVGDSVVRLGISHCQQLHKVNLSRTRVTDRGLRYLRQVPIAQVNLDGSGVTAAGVASLLAACPSIVSIRASHLQALSPEQLSDEELPS
nr:F-box/LRR-repeat protein 16-like isoform X3 [Chrysemys picta bellii]